MTKQQKIEITVKEAKRNAHQRGLVFNEKHEQDLLEIIKLYSASGEYYELAFNLFISQEMYLFANLEELAFSSWLSIGYLRFLKSCEISHRDAFPAITEQMLYSSFDSVYQESILGVVSQRIS